MRLNILKLLVCLCFISFLVCHERIHQFESDAGIKKNQSEIHTSRSNFKPERPNHQIYTSSYKYIPEGKSQFYESNLESKSQNLKSHFKDESGNYGNNQYMQDGRDFKSVSRSEEYENGRHKMHKKGVLKSAKGIFLAIMFVAFIIVFLIGLVYVGVKIVNKFLKWNEQRRLDRELKRKIGINQMKCCNCNCSNRPNEPQNTGNTTSNFTDENIITSNRANLNNFTTNIDSQDYEIINLNSNSIRELNNIRPEISYPKFVQVNSTYSDFNNRPVNKLNISSHPAAEHKGSQQINLPFLK